MRWSTTFMLVIIAVLAAACNGKQQVRKEDPNWRIPIAESKAPLLKDEGPETVAVHMGSDLIEIEDVGGDDGRRKLQGAVDDRTWEPKRFSGDFEEPAGKDEAAADEAEGSGDEAAADEAEGSGDEAAADEAEGSGDEAAASDESEKASEEDDEAASDDGTEGDKGAVEAEEGREDDSEDEGDESPDE